MNVCLSCHRRGVHLRCPLPHPHHYPTTPVPPHTESTVHTHLPALAEEDKEYNNNDDEQTNDHQSCNDNTRNDASVVRLRSGGCGGICGRRWGGGNDDILCQEKGRKEIAVAFCKMIGLLNILVLLVLLFYNNPFCFGWYIYIYVYT